MNNTIAYQYIWKISYRLVVEEDYTVLHSEEGIVHLLRQKGKECHYIQLRLADFLWEGTLIYDVRESAARLEDLRRRFGVRAMKGRIVYVCYESVADSMREALRAEQGIDEFQVSLDVAAYALLERRWISKGESSGNHMLYSSALFAETEISENDPPASYWMQRIEQTEVERERELRETFFYGRPRFTYFFLVIIIALFILMELSGGSQNPRVLLFFGAKYTPLILEGEWWRFITPMFLHIGLMHILFNGFALYSLGTLTEQLYGSVRYFIIYMLAGISGVVGSFAFSPNLSAGASGAIFGLFGALLYFGTQNKSLFFQTLGTNILVVLGINLAIGFLSPQIIDNYAHLGGLIGGFLASAIVGLPRKKGNPFIKAGAFILLAVLIWWGMKRGGL